MKSSIVKKIVAGALVVTAIPLTFMVGKNFDDIKDKIDDVFNPDEKKETGALIDGVENTDDDAQISMPKNITYVQTYDENQQKLTINVQVLPDYASNKNLSWTLGWASTNSAKASDYVDMQVGSDTHSVTLTYKKAFSTKLRLTVKSTDGSNITKTTDIDCLYRSIDTDIFKVTLNIGDISSLKVLDTCFKSDPFNISSYTGDMGTVGTISINSVEFAFCKSGEDYTFKSFTSFSSTISFLDVVKEIYSDLGFNSYQEACVEFSRVDSTALKVNYTVSYKDISISNNLLYEDIISSYNFDSQLKVSDIVIDGGAGAL